MATDESSVLKHINEVVEEEKELYSRENRSNEDNRRLHDLEVQLDQCWDLLRQRRALREFGEDPDQAHVRSAEIVEDYEN
jgi:uncharacterized protein DUF2630